MGILIIGSIGILSFDNAFAQYTSAPKLEAFITTDRDSYTPNLDIVLFGNIGDLPLPVTLEVSCDAMPNSLRYIKIFGGEQNFEVDKSGNFEFPLRTIEISCNKQTSTVTVTIQGTNASTSFQLIEWDENFKSVISASTDKTSYQKGDSVIFYGKVTNYEFGQTVSYVMNDPDGYLLSMGQIIPKSDGSFSYSFESDWTLWRFDGNYVIKYHYADDFSGKSKTTYYYSISGPVVESEPEPIIEPTQEYEHEPVPTPDSPLPAPAEIDIKFDIGSSVPGCELSNSCFNPSSLSVDAGETITWYNADTATHTVTSGTPSGGPDGIFDSSLIMPGSTFSVTLTQPGTYTYFSMMHPWAIGEIIVQGSGTSSSDITPPHVIVPSDMTIDAGTADFVKLEYSVKAIDDVDGVITPTCDVGSGTVISVKRLASVVVTCTAIDSAGNTGSASFLVTVTSSSDTTPDIAPLDTTPPDIAPPDTTPPYVIVPSDMTIDPGTADFVKLEYSVKAIDDVDGVIKPTCDVRSGTEVSVRYWSAGLVTCTATDSAGNTGSDSFWVTITSSGSALEEEYRDNYKQEHRADYESERHDDEYYRHNDEYKDYDRYDGEYPEIKELEDRILAQISMDEIESFMMSRDYEGLRDLILSRTDLTEDEVMIVFDFHEEYDDEYKDYDRYNDEYKNYDRYNVEHKNYDRYDEEHKNYDRYDEEHKNYDQSNYDSGDIERLEQKIDELKEENRELRSTVDELSKILDDLNAIVMGQVSTFYDWIFNQ